MSVRVEIVCENADGGEQRREVLSIEQSELAMETLGMNLSDGKALLAGVHPAAQLSALYSVGLRCRIRDGTAAPARRTATARIRSVR